MAKSRKPAPRRPVENNPAPGALAQDDINLIIRVTHRQRKCSGLQAGALFGVYELPRADRQQLEVVLRDVLHRKEVTSAVWHRRCVELHEICARIGPDGAGLADAFIMSEDEWRATYAPGEPSRGGR